MAKIEITTTTGTHAFQVEVAKDDASRTRGLAGRRFMPPDHGMLFEFDGEAPRTFNMRGVQIPLDIVFLSQIGAVTRIVANVEPGSEHPIRSVTPCMAVLELNGGTAAKLGLKVGDKVEGATMATEQIDPRLLEAAKHDPILANMVKWGHPLTREEWIRRAHTLSGVPEPWTAEDEQKVPRVFRKKNPDNAD